MTRRRRKWKAKEKVMNLLLSSKLQMSLEVLLNQLSPPMMEPIDRMMAPVLSEQPREHIFSLHLHHHQCHQHLDIILHFQNCLLRYSQQQNRVTVHIVLLCLTYCRIYEVQNCIYFFLPSIFQLN